MDSKIETVNLLRKLGYALKDRDLILLSVLVEASPRPIKRRHLLAVSGLKDEPFAFEDGLRKLHKAGLVGKLKSGRETYYYPNL